MMSLGSEVFYDSTLACGGSPEPKMAVHQHMRMPADSVSVALIDVYSETILSAKD